MIYHKTPLIVLTTALCIYGSSSTYADILDQQQKTDGNSGFTFTLNPVKKLSSIAEKFNANHLLLTSEDFTFKPADFISNSQTLLANGYLNKSALPKSNGMIFASLALMLLIVRRRIY